MITDEKPKRKNKRRPRTCLRTFYTMLLFVLGLFICVGLLCFVTLALNPLK